MRMQVQRWFLLIAAILFLGVGSYTITQAFNEAHMLSFIGLGLFYWLVGNMCIWQHVRDVAGDWDDDEPWASYER